METLAYQVYPIQDGKIYTESDLMKRQSVVELFDYCQILQAAITAAGWKFIFKNYGVPELLNINFESGWYEQEDIELLITHSLISGYDPINDEMGTWEDEESVFYPNSSSYYCFDFEMMRNWLKAMADST